jgi:hypothetical protein
MKPKSASDGTESASASRHGIIILPRSPIDQAEGGRGDDRLTQLTAYAAHGEPVQASVVGRYSLMRGLLSGRSKNGSRAWSGTAACASALSLRAYREWRKAARFPGLSERDPG